MTDEREIGMKVAKVRDGEKFVLDDRGGVWEKVGVDADGKVKARCYFGPRGVYGTEITIDPEAYSYVMFEDRPKPFGRDAGHAMPGPEQAISLGAKIRIVDEVEDTLVKEITDPSVGQLAVMATTERIRFVPPGQRDVKIYGVSDFAYDVDENILYLMVRAEHEKDEESDKHENGRRH